MFDNPPTFLIASRKILPDQICFVQFLLSNLSFLFSKIVIFSTFSTYFVKTLPFFRGCIIFYCISKKLYLFNIPFFTPPCRNRLTLYCFCVFIHTEAEAPKQKIRKGVKT